MSAEGLSQEETDFCIKQAEDAGFVVCRGAPDVLLLDLDSPEAVAQFERVFEAFARNFDFLGAERWKSKSGNTHIRIRLSKPWDIQTRLVLQAALGSDGVKEMLTMLRVWNGIEEPSMLFQPPGAVIESIA